MLDLTKYPHMRPREVSTLEAANQPRPRQEGWYFPDERINGRYKNEMMNLLSEALKANNLEPVDDYITEYLARGPCWGATARTIHTLAPIMNDAVVADNAPFAKKLLERGICFPDTYIHTALEAHALRCMTLFLDRGFDLNKPQSVSAMPVWGTSEAATTDRTLLYWLLERGANLNIDTKWASITAMSYIVEDASLDLVRDLLDDPRDLVDVYKGDLLHHALKRQTDIAPVLGLLLDHGAPINDGLFARHPGAQSMFFFMPRGPPLHEAAESGQLEAVCYLVSRHADVMVRDTQGKTALDYARAKGHADITVVLQKAMADAGVQYL